MLATAQARASTCPQRSEHVQARKVGRDTLIVHLLLKQYHVLNHIAGRIWDLADGKRSADQIAAEIAAEFGIDRATVSDDVASTLQTLSELRLIEFRAPS
jgi:pyrroloquinoline quinone biosynthesis protein D